MSADDHPQDDPPGVVYRITRVFVDGPNRGRRTTWESNVSEPVGHHHSGSGYTMRTLSCVPVPFREDELS